MTSRPPRAASPAEGTAGPPVDVVRQADSLLLMASLPGAKPDDFQVSLVGDRQIRIEGTAHYRHPVPQESLLLAERRYGPFARTLSLPFPVDAQGIGIWLVGGTITARLPLRMQPVPLAWGVPGR